MLLRTRQATAGDLPFESALRLTPQPTTELPDPRQHLDLWAFPTLFVTSNGTIGDQDPPVGRSIVRCDV